MIKNTYNFLKILPNPSYLLLPIYFYSQLNEKIDVAPKRPKHSQKLA